MSRKSITILIVIVILAIIAISYPAWNKNDTDTPGSVTNGKVNGNPTDFWREGTISFDNTGTTTNNVPSFRYAVGTSTSSTSASAMATSTLLFDELSFCTANSGSEQCIALNTTLDVILDGKRATVEGIRQADGILVRKIYVPGEGETVLTMDPGSVFITWEQTRGFVESCAPTLVMQTHALDVYLTMKNGTRLRTVEPTSDDIFDIVESVRDTCGNIPIATE
jgi:hypothetical protein